MHPNDLELLDLAEGINFARAAEVAGHVRGCAQCSAALLEMAAATDEAELPTSNDADFIRFPATRMNEDHPEPAAGQIWKAQWEGTSAIVLVTSASDTDVQVSPVIDAEDADDGSVLLSPEFIGWAIAVRAVAAVTMPTCVLDYCLAVLDESQLERISSVRHGAQGDGLPIVNPLDERWDGAAFLQLQLRRLETAGWVPAGMVEPVDFIRSQWTGPRALSEAIGVTPGRALEILNGAGALTDGERAAVLHATGQAVGAGSPPPDLRWALDQPQVRPLWRKFAAVNHATDTAEFRWQTYSNGSFALAARSSASMTARGRALATVKQVLDAGA